MKAKDKRHLSEDQVVQTAKDSDCMIVGEEECIYILFMTEGTILTRIKQ